MALTLLALAGLTVAFATGVAALLAWGIEWLSGLFGLEIPFEVRLVLGGVVTFIAGIVVLRRALGEDAAETFGAAVVGPEAYPGLHATVTRIAQAADLPAPSIHVTDRERPLAVHGPHGTRSELEELVGVAGTDPAFPLRITQNAPGDAVLSREEYEVRAVGTDHRTQSVGYALVEDDRKGRFDREKAEEELGIPPGPKYSRLHRGKPVEHDGRTVHPEEVVGPPRPGRRFVYTGDTRPTEAVIEAATEADLLVHDGTFADDWADRARATGHSTAREAARVASEAGARRLALTHISTRYAGDPSPIERQAREAFDGEAFVAEDGQQYEVPFPDE